MKTKINDLKMVSFKVLSLTLLGFLFLNSCKQTENAEIIMKYPVSKKVDTVDIYFGTNVADPYRWLEDDNSEETKAWVDSQNVITFDYLSKIPFRDSLKSIIQNMWNYPKFGLPFKKGDFWYQYKNDGLQAQSVLYQLDSPDGKAKVFLDPNTFSADGTIALAGLSFSEDGKYCAYSISKGGSDWNEIFVIEVASNTKLDDHLEWIKFSGISWKGDGFYYSSFPKPTDNEVLKAKNLNQKVYFHKIGTSQGTDVLTYEQPAKPERMWGVGTTDDEKFLILSGSDPNFKGNSLSYKSSDSKGGFVTVEESFDYDCYIAGNVGDTVYVKTNKNAPNNKVYAFVKGKETKIFDILPEKKDVLESVMIFGKYIIATYLHDASSQAFVYDFDGKLKHQINLPGIGTLSGFGGDEKSMTIFYSFTSFTMPNTSFSYDIEKNESKVFQKPDLKFNSSDYETKQVFYTSKDGTKIPMFLVYKKGLKLDGNNPTMLYGYGGFNVNLTPSFSVDRMVWIDNGGVYAQPTLRGGGEYGEEWHQAGTQLNKQNVFDDFITAAEYLISNKYTSKDYLAISGRSNGGLLVGACMVQRPDLFKVAFPGVGVLDMLRYHKFTIGYYWAADYGTSDDSIQFANLIKYSPLHNLKEGVCYPSTLIVTADHDDRVFPAHSFKFAARLQEVQGCNKPVIIRIDKNAGHGAGKPTDMVISDKADQWAFAFFEMGIKPFKKK